MGLINTNTCEAAQLPLKAKAAEARRQNSSWQVAAGKLRSCADASAINHRNPPGHLEVSTLQLPIKYREK
jgi:hypothetical protein